MDGQLAVLDEGRAILDVRCSERDGEVVRTVRLPQLTPRKMQYYWSRLKEFDHIFSDHTKTFEDFVNIFLYEKNGTFAASGIIWEVDDVGILFLTNIQPGFAALGHFTFWDRKLCGREELMREMLRYLFARFKFHRIYSEHGLYAANSISPFLKRIGFKKEGRKREAVLYKGDWFDVNQFSILEHEV